MSSHKASLSCWTRASAKDSKLTTNEELLVVQTKVHVIQNSVVCMELLSNVYVFHVTCVFAYGTY